jgi:hypothetical protein
MFQLIGNKRIKGRMSSPLQIHIRSSYRADETKNIQAVKKHEEHAAQPQAQRFPLDAEKTAQEQLEIENNVANGALQAMRLSVGSFTPYRQHFDLTWWDERLLQTPMSFAG